MLTAMELHYLLGKSKLIMILDLINILAYRIAYGNLSKIWDSSVQGYKKAQGYRERVF